MKDDLTAAINNSSIGKPTLDKQPRLSVEMQALLTKQIMNEMHSCNLYKQLAGWLDDNDWTFGAKLFMKYGNEETAHADKVIEYMFERNCKVDILAIEKPVISVKNVRDVLLASLEHEILVSNQWKTIAAMAMKEADLTTFGIAQWFINEQVEEESKFRDFLFKLNLNMPEYELDEEFKDALEG